MVFHIYVSLPQANNYVEKNVITSNDITNPGWHYIYLHIVHIVDTSYQLWIVIKFVDSNLIIITIMTMVVVTSETNIDNQQQLIISIEII